MLVKVGGTLRSHISSGDAVRTFAHPVLRDDRDCGIDRARRIRRAKYHGGLSSKLRGNRTLLYKENPGDTGKGNHG
jgi:hypothetical protein